MTGRLFTVGVYLDSLVFTPASSGIGQSDGRKAAERFLTRYIATGSLRPADYKHVTRNSSYLVALVRQTNVVPEAPRHAPYHVSARAHRAP